MRMVLFSVWICVAGIAHADAFKCRTPEGKTVISDVGCANGASQEKRSSGASLSADQVLQAQDVNARRASQLRSMEIEDERYRSKNQQEAIQRQQMQAAESEKKQAVSVAAHDEDAYRQCVRDVERRAAKPDVKAEMIAACRTSGLVQRNSGIVGDAVSRCVKDIERSAASEKEKARQIATCHGGDVKPEPIPQPKKFIEEKPLAVIKSCNNGTCNDQYGNRYRTDSSGNFVTQDGRRCTGSGTTLHCN